MGLDMYFYSVKPDQVLHRKSDIDFRLTDEAQNAHELYYYRKHNRLNGWLQHLFISKGGDEYDFNCSYMILTIKDLKALKRDIRLNLLHHASGFFWGDNEVDRSDKARYYDMIKDLINCINRGEVVYYYPNW